MISLINHEIRLRSQWGRDEIYPDVLTHSQMFRKLFIHRSPFRQKHPSHRRLSWTCRRCPHRARRVGPGWDCSSSCQRTWTHGTHGGNLQEAKVLFFYHRYGGPLDFPLNQSVDFREKGGTGAKWQEHGLKMMGVFPKMLARKGNT